MKKVSLSISLLLLGLLWFVTSSQAVEVTVFGPYQYTRDNGQPSTFTDDFTALPKQGVIHVQNGDGAGQGQVSSGEILLNGVEVFKTSDFKQNVFQLEASVELLETNSISIELTSKPGSYLEVWVTEDVDPPTATLTVSPQSIPLGESAELSWTSEHADTCLIEPEIGEVDVNSSISVSPVETTTYTIICSGLGGSFNAEVSLEVVDPPTVIRVLSVTL